MNSNLIILESFIFSSFQINKLGLPRFFDINSYVIRQPYPFSTSFVRFSFTCEQIISTIKFLQKKKSTKKFSKITYLSRKFGSKASPLLGCVVAFGYSDFFSSFDRRALFFCFWTSLSDELSESPDDDDELEDDELKVMIEI